MTLALQNSLVTNNRTTHYLFRNLLLGYRATWNSFTSSPLGHSSHLKHLQKCYWTPTIGFLLLTWRPLKTMLVVSPYSFRKHVEYHFSCEHIALPILFSKNFDEDEEAAVHVMMKRICWRQGNYEMMFRSWIHRIHRFFVCFLLELDAAKHEEMEMVAGRGWKVKGWLLNCRVFCYIWGVSSILCLIRHHFGKVHLGNRVFKPVIAQCGIWYA